MLGRPDRENTPAGWGYLGGIPKVSIYLPDDLYQQARAHELPLSSLAQQAIENALAAALTEEWVTRVRARPPRHDRVLNTSAVLDAVDEEFER